MYKAKKVDVVDYYHGHAVSDPYRWLEDAASEETREWVLAQNEESSAFLSAYPGRDSLRQRVTQLWDYPRYLLPVKKGARYFYQFNSGLKNQAVLYVTSDVHGEGQEVLDPNTLSQDGTVALTGFSPCREGKLLAYSVSRSGSDWQEIRVRDVDSGSDLPDLIRHCKFTSVNWAPDNSGFFYTRFPDPATVEPGQESYNSQVCYHRLGTTQAEDELVFSRPDFPELGFHAQITEDDRYIVLTVWHGTDTENRFYYRELSASGPFVRLLDDADASYNYVTNVGARFFFRTNKDAPRSRVIAIDVSRPDAPWEEIVPEQDDALEAASAAGGSLVLTYLHHARHAVHLYDLDGSHCGELSFPGPGTVLGPSGRYGDDEMFMGFTSYLYPLTVFRYDFASASLAPWREIELPFDPAQYESRQEFFLSPDGTRVPIYLNYRRGVAKDGSNPTILYGYGGFNISLTPAFAPAQIAWMDQGGIYAVACLRGGGEYGEAWHRDGMLGKKQNVFDDFIAAARWLVTEEYTSVSRLGIMGGSNGGLLVAACMVQAPESFGAVVCRVPVIDMLRYHRFTVGRYWTGEYGNAETNPEHFRFLYAYSPLHNIRPGVDYPATLIMTADTDDRVVPAHAMKFAATLKEHYSGKNPIITRVEMKAGHGAGKPTGKLIDEVVDIYSFLLQVFPSA